MYGLDCVSSYSVDLHLKTLLQLLLLTNMVNFSMVTLCVCVCVCVCVGGWVCRGRKNSSTLHRLIPIGSHQTWNNAGTT